MVRLHINVDHVATLRQQRDTIYPDPVLAAGFCELAGADGITAHLREDRRHVQERDVRILRQTVRGVLNLEMAAVLSIVDIALEVEPDLCTLVPEKREERTTEGGLDLRGQGTVIGRAVRSLRDAGIGVSLFIDPEEDAARACADLGRYSAELHTGDYCHAALSSEAARVSWPGWRRQGEPWRTLGCAWPRATASTTPTLVRWRLCLSGRNEHRHSVVSRAVMVGMERAVIDMRAAMAAGPGTRSRDPLALVLSAAQMKAVDRAAIDKLGLPEDTIHPIYLEIYFI